MTDEAKTTLTVFDSRNFEPGARIMLTSMKDIPAWKRWWLKITRQSLPKTIQEVMIVHIVDGTTITIIPIVH